MSAMSIYGPPYYDWMQVPPSSATTAPATRATPNIPQGKSDLQAERLRLLRKLEEERMRQQASWEEQQRRLHEEQQRKLCEEQERVRQQRKYADANWRRILLEHCRLAMQKMRTDAAYLHECREAYESTWAELTRPVPSPGSPKYINVVYFPWP